MDWDGTPVRDGCVSPIVPDRRPVGVFWRGIQTNWLVPLFLFHSENPLLSTNLPRRDLFRDCPINSFPLTLFSVMNRLHIIRIKLIQQLSGGEDGRI